jgi:peptidoglycan hydrolase CwlO-like protein
MIKREVLETFSAKAIKWIGSVESLIIHTVLFIVFFVLYVLGIDISTVLLVLTTIVSLEAIYLSIFIQMSVNFQAKKLESVASDVEDIQKDVEEIQEDVEDIQEDVEDIQEDVEDIQEDVEEFSEEDDEEDEEYKKIKETMDLLLKEVSDLKRSQKRSRNNA